MPGRAAWYSRTRTAVPVGAPTAVDILASFPPVRGLVCWQHRLRGSREVGVLLAQAASSSSAQRQMWRSLGARSIYHLARRVVLHDLDAALSLRSQVGFAAAVAHARLRLSRLELIRGSGRTRTGRPLRICRARLHFADRLRAGAGRRSGSGWRQGRVRWGRPLLSRPRGAVGSGPAAVLAAVESGRGFGRRVEAWSCGCVGGFGWL